MTQIGRLRNWVFFFIVLLCIAGLGGALWVEAATPKGELVSQGPPLSSRFSRTNSALRAEAARASVNGLPVFPSQSVDWADDEPTRLRRAGLLKGALPLPSANRGGLGGERAAQPDGCTFDIECEDGLACTMDRCDIEFGGSIGSGTCSHDILPAGSPGDCDDGVFCNGIEFCDGVNGATCAQGPPATCCDDPESEFDEYCTETVARCDDNSIVPGARCTEDADCGGGTCDHCVPSCSVAADCDDGFSCNGGESCDGNGECQPGAALCGNGAVCSEKRCRHITTNANQQPLTACTVDGDCALNHRCVGGTVADALCFLGRCCSSSTNPACTNQRLWQSPNPCNLAGGSKWFAGDLGRETGESSACGGVNPNFPGVQLGCPKYSSGIEQTSATAIPTHPVAAGPVSQSAASVNPPNGPGVALHRLGDDYSFSNSSHIDLRAIRLVGFMAVPDSIFIEFWDADGVFIEDLLYRPSTAPGVNVVYLNQPLIIPPQGRISAVTKREFGLNAKFVWLSAAHPAPNHATTGSNDPDVLFVNDDINASNFMSPEPGVLSFELVGEKVDPPLGGCCKNDGSCSNEVKWDCDQAGGFFQGVGILCYSCVHATNHGTSCGRCAVGEADCTSDEGCGVDGPCQPVDSVCLGSRCSNDDNRNCSPVGSACPARPGTCSNADRECVLDGDCAGGMCGGEGVCMAAECSALEACGLGACCDSVSGNCSVAAPGDCATPSEFLGVGTDCVPNCCPQPAADTDCSDGICYTGADDCTSAFVHVIPALTPADPAYIVTITGDRTFASSTESDPDSCWGPAVDFQSDRGWFEAFELTGSCTRIRFDYCCTTPTQFGDWAFLAKDCDCNHFLQPEPDPNLTIQSSDGRGEPFCDEDNLWVIMGLMRAGTYYIPVNSTLEDDLGSYQLHILAEACPTAACCLPDGNCTETSQFGCEDAGGVFLGPPTRFPSVAECDAETCATGSCCLGPNICQDEINGTPITDASCSGTYLGGLKCEGGTCADNPNYSCNDAGDCAAPGPGGLCNAGPGGVRALAQLNPCPICEFEGPNNCNIWDDPSGFAGSISELGLGSGLVSADDFIPAAGTTQISQICVHGFYFLTDPEAPGLDCHAQVTADHFRVRVMKSTPEGLPDDSPTGIVGISTVTVQARVIIPRPGHLPVGDDYEVFGYQLQLDDAIGPLNDDSSTVYWLEVANNLAPTDGCFWLWSQISNESSQGNDFSAAGSGTAGYVIGSERPEDLAFCISPGGGAPGNFLTPESPMRPCCTCEGFCLMDTLAVCKQQPAEYHIDEESCAGLCPVPAQPEHDDCHEASIIYVGTSAVSTACTTTDGINPIGKYPLSILYDEWFEFTAPQSCTLRVDMCATGDAFDSVLAVYSTGTGTCVCPTTEEIANQTLIAADDENCAAGAAVGGAGFIEVPAIAGQCFTIRVGSWGPGGTRGTGLLDISCGPPMCGNSVAEASNGEECDGVDDSACPFPGSCNPPGHPAECQCGAPSCGNGVLEGNEQCDPGPPAADDACPGFCQANCTCVSACGDGVKQAPEECDGEDDTSCGGVPGRCCIGPDNPVAGCTSSCTCPPVACGNGFKDPKEECDPGEGTSNDGDEDDCSCAGLCRLPNDPVGECTCACGYVLIDPPYIGPDPNHVSQNRFVGVVVPSWDDPCLAMPPGLTALRVTLTTLNHPRICCNSAAGTSCSSTTCNVDAHCAGVPGNSVCAHQAGSGTPDFSSMESKVRYVNSFPGGSLVCPDDGSPLDTSYRCATLGCQPEYRDWAADLAIAVDPSETGGLIFITGDALVPSSTVEISMIAPVCGAAPGANTCTSATPPLQLGTAAWGDITSAAFGLPDGKADVLDIPAVVNKLKGIPTCSPQPCSTIFPEHRVWLKQQDPRPDSDAITVIDLSDVVDALLGKPYPSSRTIDACPHD